MNLSPEIDYQRRFGALSRLYGTSGAARIQSAHILVIGIGGVGSWTVESLVRSGVKTITLIDLDHVAESNINRQIQATSATIGQAKVQAMRERIELINPLCTVNCIEEFVTPENWIQLLPKNVDAVIDACDQVSTKVSLAAWALHSKLHFISVGAAGGKQLAHLVDIDDLSKTTHDPLLAQLRYRLRKEHGAAREGRKIGITCVFSREAVMQPHISCQTKSTDGSLNCHGYGSSVSVTATFGNCAASWIISKLAN